MRWWRWRYSHLIVSRRNKSKEKKIKLRTKRNPVTWEAAVTLKGYKRNLDSSKKRTSKTKDKENKSALWKISLMTRVQWSVQMSKRINGYKMGAFPHVLLQSGFQGGDLKITKEVAMDGWMRLIRWGIKEKNYEENKLKKRSTLY